MFTYVARLRARSYLFLVTLSVRTALHLILFLVQASGDKMLHIHLDGRAGRATQAQSGVAVGVTLPDCANIRFSRIYSRAKKNALTLSNQKKAIANTKTPRKLRTWRKVGHARTEAARPRRLFQAKGGFRATQETTKLRPWVCR